MQFVMNVLHVSGVEDQEAENGGEDDHPEARFAEMLEEEGTEIETGTEIGSGIGIEKGKETGGLDAQEGHLRKGLACFKRET